MSAIFYHSVLPGAAVFPVFLYVFRKRQKRNCRQKRLRILREDFREVVAMLSSFLRAGYSAENAMEKACRQLMQRLGKEGDMAGILSRMLREIHMGESAEEVWLHFAREAPLEEIQDFGQIFSLSKRSGVSLPEVLQRVEAQLAQKLQTEAQIDTLIAGKRMEQRVMNLMPAGILVYICVTSGDMMQIMYTTITGRVVMTVCLAVYAGAFCLADRMLSSIESV